MKFFSWGLVPKYNWGLVPTLLIIPYKDLFLPVLSVVKPTILRFLLPAGRYFIFTCYREISLCVEFSSVSDLIISPIYPPMSKFPMSWLLLVGPISSQTYSTFAQCMSLSLLINFAAIMLRIRTPRSFALTSPVPISQFDQSYVNLFTYSFIKCFLSVEHYWFPQFEYMITINSFHPFEDWVSWVVAQLLSGGRQIKTPANVNVYFYSFCRKGKKLTIVSSKSRNNFAISRNKLQSQSIVSNCCFNFYILNQYFTCRHHICATSSL